MMKKLTYSTALAGVLALGMYGMAHAQTTSPTQPGAATAPGSTMGQTGTTQRQPGAKTGQSAQDIRMSEQQIRSMLESRGYSDISGLERDGDNFKVSEAKRYGADVEDLKVNARTGQVQDEKRLTEDQAKSMLRDRGFSNVTDMKRDGDNFSAKAKQGDRSVELRIDAQTGTVTQQSAAN